MHDESTVRHGAPTVGGGRVTVQLERLATAPAAPTPWWRAHWGVVAALLCAVLTVPGATVAVMASSAPAGTAGHDVSYPQCGTALPTSGTFGIVGVNGGRVSTTNPCLATQYAWARAKPGGAALYVNTGNPGAISTFYWPRSGDRDPALCTDRDDPADPGCAYDYGWHGAEHSLGIARGKLGDEVLALDWWLDVELANSWNGSPAANAATLQGAIDRLRGLGVASVGIYATTYQWGVITGGYRASNAATYRAGWAGAFTPRYPMETAPLWIAGLSTRAAAVENCGVSFTGAPATLAQFTDDEAGGLDGNVVCGSVTDPGTPPTSPATTTTTTSARSTTTTTTAGPSATTTSSAPVVPPVTSTTTTTRPAPTTTTTAPPTTTTTPPRTTTTPPRTTTTPPRTTTTPPRTTTTPPVTAPGVPRSVVARTHPSRGIALSWAVPASSGGATVTRYTIYRGTTPTRLVALGTLTCTTPTCAWQDTSVTGGRAAYYRVVAVNTANRSGPASPVVGARGR